MSNLLGIDIGANTIKVASVSKVGEKLILDAAGEIKTPEPDWINSENKPKSLEQVAGAVKTLMTDLKLKSRQVVVCLPEDEVISRLVRLPSLKDAEIRDALKYEAETFVPYPLDQVSIDYEIIEKDDSGRLTIFVIAARNDLIQSYVKLVKGIGLELVALESPAIAMRRMINNYVPNTNGVIVFDMGEKYSDIIGLNKGNVHFTRSMSIGGESLTRAISINLGLDMASAEEYKKAYGLKENDLEGKIRSAVMPVFTNIAEEIRKSIAFFMEEHGRNIDLLVLSGGGANLPGFAEELTKLMGVEVQTIQPFININAQNTISNTNLSTDGCRYSLALGLAMRGLI